MRDLLAYSRELAEARADLPRVLLEAGRRVAGRAKARARDLAPRSTGALRRSIDGRAVAERDGVAVELAAGVEYASVQERGGVLRPTRSRYLAVPVGPGLSTRMSPRHIPSLRMIPEGDGGRLVDRAEVTWFVLKPQVVVRGTGFMARAAREAVGPARIEVDEALQALLGGG